MTTRTAALTALFALSTSALAAEPAQLKSIDPLTLPAPTILEPMSFAPDPRTPAEKIQPMLWAEALKQGADAVIPIIITLHEPLLAEPLRGATPEADAYRIGWVASLAHEFAPLARDRGLKGARALSHFPILFGEIHPRDIVRLAELRQVLTIRRDEPIHSTRAQGEALMNAANLRTLYGGNGTGKGIAIFDSGVDVSHGEFLGRAYVYGNFTTSPGNGDTDVYGHGTKCAGIALGSAGGMAPLAKLWTMKVLRDDGTGSDSEALSGLNTVYGARTQYGGVHVLSLSLGGGGPYNSDCDALYPDYASVFNAFVAAGIPVFVASGNDSSTIGIAKPACLSNAISVGAVSDAAIGTSDPGCPPSFNYTAADQILCYSNSGIPLDVLAPSACATTTAPGGGYVSCFNGTSAATPYAAGVAAQILSLLPATTPAQLRTALMTTGRPITDVNSITRNRIDAVEAYQALAGGGGCSPCVADATTLCLDGGSGNPARFRVRVNWTDFASGTGAGQAVPNTPDAGFFYFFDADNLELLVKMARGCGSPLNAYWFFYAAASNVALEYEVLDTVACVTKTYSNPLGNFASYGDVNAFATCP